MYWVGRQYITNSLNSSSCSEITQIYIYEFTSLCSEITEIHIRIYAPFWPDKVMRDLHCWEWQQSTISVFFFFSLSLINGLKTCYLTLRFATECLSFYLYSIDMTLFIHWTLKHGPSYNTVKPLHTGQCFTIHKYMHFALKRLSFCRITQFSLYM
jgi:hypothetical protein